MATAKRNSDNRWVLTGLTDREIELLRDGLRKLRGGNVKRLARSLSRELSRAVERNVKEMEIGERTTRFSDEGHL